MIPCDPENRSWTLAMELLKQRGHAQRQVYEKHPAHLAVVEKNIKPLISPGSRAAIQHLGTRVTGGPRMKGNLMILNVCFAWAGFFLLCLVFGLALCSSPEELPWNDLCFAECIANDFPFYDGGEVSFETSNSKVHQLNIAEQMTIAKRRGHQLFEKRLQRAIAHHLECAADCFKCFKRTWVELPKKIIQWHGGVMFQKLHCTILHR